MNSANNCFTLPQNSRFLHVLANYILESYSTEEYPKILILLPNRRSCRSLRESFLEATSGKPMLLPRIQPIGEIDGEAFLIHHDILTQQPVDPIRRKFLLMQLIMRFQQNKIGGGAPNQAAELARQLANLIDEVNREGLSFEKLSQIAPEDLQEHWQQTLDFLTIVSQKWPELLAEEGVFDVVTHRNHQLYSIANAWSKSPPPFPVIAAGSTGSQSATANLLKVIANIPNGKVILPSLDKEMQKNEWEAIGETHPQYALKKLLKKIGIEREMVKYLPVTNDDNIAKNDKYNSYIRTIFAPPQVTANWAKINLPEPETLESIKLTEADTLLDEARVIAVAMRKALETPEKTVAMVTPDRTLARMVSAQLLRFGINVDDSAGKPLINSPSACFLRLVAEMVASRFAPSALLAVLRHPIAAGGINTAQCRRLSRELEILLLRGIRRDEGIRGLRMAATKNNKSSAELIDMLGNLEEKSAAFSELFTPHQNAPLQQILTTHIEFSEWLASTDTQNGMERLWANDSGNALAELIAQWNIQSEILPPIEALSYPALFDSLLATETYHSKIGFHPRLHILSPLEARLQSYDMVILSSLNEGTWPQISQPDPWMSRPQRAEFGLPAKEVEIGKSAHDFVMLLYSPSILLTRARKVEGTPTIPSRWWVRLQTLVGGREEKFFMSMNQDNYFSALKEELEKPAYIPALLPPSPAPPASSRPRKLRVTAIDIWIKDPYSIYARYILNLRKMDEIDREPNAADFGNLVHKALEIFTRSFPEKIPDGIDIKDKLIEAGKTAFTDFLDRPAVACLWWPRFEAMATWLANEEKSRRASIEVIHSEIEASWDFYVDDKIFTLNTRIDRLERLKSGEYSVIDYKTGMIPKKNDRESGISNQLPLEALIIENGKLPASIKQGVVSQMQYWKLSGSEDKCEITDVKSDKENTRKLLEDIIRKFDHPDTVYNAQNEGSTNRNNDYEHLTRRKEWEVV